jgi:hypothetical protein
MPSGRDQGFDGFDRALARGMTTAADAGIMRRRFIAPRDAVGIVTSLAGEPAFTFSETSGLTQPVDRTYGLELVIVARTGSVIEEQEEVRERLTRHIRERAFVETLQRRRKTGAGGLEVALHAYFHGAIGAEPGWIYDRGTNVG